MCPHPEAARGRDPGPVLADVDEDAVVRLLLSVFSRGPELGPGSGPQLAGGTAPRDDAVVLGIGDDAAVVAARSGAVVATTDTMVRGQDWRDDWSTGTEVGRKVVTQNVADVAAMGAVPTGLLVTLVADPATPLAWVEDLARGIATGAHSYGAPVVGGDLSSAPPGLVTVSITALGDLEGRVPVRRSGARPGDVVAVRGSLGRSGAGLLLHLEDAETIPGEADPGPAESLRRFHRAPTCPAGSGPRAAAAGATSMIDVSDGVSRDAARVAVSSGVRISLSRSALVQGFCTGDLLAVLGPDGALDQVLHGGEEHSLLATFPAATGPDPDGGWTVIGTVEALRPGEAPGVGLDGAPLVPAAWDHFHVGPGEG